MIDAFEFVDAGRTFICSIEARHLAEAEEWWWFRIAQDTQHQRYAPFRAASDDTRDGVRARIVAYYDELVARRTMPTTSSHWGRRPGGQTRAPAAAPAAPHVVPEA